MCAVPRTRLFAEGVRSWDGLVRWAMRLKPLEDLGVGDGQEVRGMGWEGRALVAVARARAVRRRCIVVV